MLENVKLYKILAYQPHRVSKNKKYNNNILVAIQCQPFDINGWQDVLKDHSANTLRISDTNLNSIVPLARLLKNVFSGTHSAKSHMSNFPSKYIQSGCVQGQATSAITNNFFT